MKKVKDVDEYISMFPEETQTLLSQLRDVVKNTVPKATEVISYNMPAYMLEGRLLYFAAFSKHIGFYPMTSTIANFEKSLALYKHAKGSVQFPLDQPLPVTLITKMIKFRAKENIIRAKEKKRKK